MNSVFRILRFYLKRLKRKLRMTYRILRRTFVSGKRPLRLEKREVITSKGIKFLGQQSVKPTTIIAYIYEYYYYDGRSWIYTGVNKETVLVCKIGDRLYYPIRHADTNNVEHLMGYYLEYLSCMAAPK